MIKKAALIFLWVVHISAIIGIVMGQADFFLPKSPYTLMYILILCIAFIPVLTRRTWLLFGLFFLTGYVAEWIGVHTGFLFGDYYYGKNFGPKIDEIPILIGVNWAVLTTISHIISHKSTSNLYLKAVLGASLMVLLDFFLEQICDFAGFWHFEGGAGWFNYVCWWIIAFILHLLAGKFKLRGDFKTALNIYSVQLIFTAALWIIITT